MAEQERTVGDIIDALGVRMPIADGDLPAGAVVIVKVISQDGDAGISMAVHDGCSWLEQLGIIEAARSISLRTPVSLIPITALAPASAGPALCFSRRRALLLRWSIAIVIVLVVIALVSAVLRRRTR